jgi:ribosomal protein S12 methylthiotransferase
LFVYSPQEGTAAFRLDNRVPEAIAIERRNELDRLQFDITYSFNKAHVGKTYDFIFQGETEEGLFGRIYSQAPVVDGIVHVDKVISGQGLSRVFIEDTNGLDLLGRN